MWRNAQDCRHDRRSSSSSRPGTSAPTCGRGAASTACAASLRSAQQRHRRNVRVLALPEDEEKRARIKHLTRLFYAPSAQQAPSPARKPGAAALSGVHLQQLPLWRVEWAVLPGMQEILHVLAPHYVHMFEAIFSRPRPWLFGHLHLPGGSRSLGDPAYALASGSRAPLVGVLMQVTRAVRLRDGKFLVLATALGRIRVVRAVRDLPYAEADVELLEDCEVLEAYGARATAAVMQAASDDASVSALMAASSTAAREAAAAAHWSWLKGYELSVAARQEWPGPGPREGENDAETYYMVQELAEQGVAEVLPLPDGVVIGRCNLQEVAATVEAAVAAAMQRVAAEANSQAAGSTQQQDAPTASSSDRPGSALAMTSNNSSSTSSSSSGGGGDASPWSSTEGAATGITSLNTATERGVNLQGPEFKELTRSSSASSSLADVLMLEAAVWQQLDILAALSSRVKGRRHSLPFGLLQLRPPQLQLHAAGADRAARAPVNAGAAGSDAGSSSKRGSASFEGSWTEGLQPQGTPDVASDTPSDARCSSATGSTSSGSSSSAPDPPGTSGTPSSRGSAQPAEEHALGRPPGSRYAFAASEGMDVHADPLWPPLRRAAKLSWAAALATGQVELDKGELRQALLEAPSIAARLRFVLAVLQKHAKVLAALAAVKDVQQ